MKVLVYSSGLFILPAVYGICYQIYFLPFTLVVCSAISANYWRDPVDSWRKTVDLIYAKFIFVLFIFHGCPLRRIISYPHVVITCYCYYYSCVLYNKNINIWWMYHVAFHIFLLFGQCTVIYDIIQMKNEINI